MTPGASHALLWLLLSLLLPASLASGNGPRIHIYDLPERWARLPGHTCHHWDCARLEPAIRSSPYFEPDPEKADLFFIPHPMPFVSIVQAYEIMEYVRAAFPYVNASIAANQTRHFIALTCDHGPGDCNYMERDGHKRDLPGWWDPASGSRVVGHIQWNGLCDGVDAQQRNCLVCFQRGKDVQIATAENVCGPLCGYGRAELAKYSPWSRSAEHRAVREAAHAEGRFSRTNLFFYGGRLHAGRGPGDPTGRAQLLAFRNESDFKIVNTVGDDPDQPLPPDERKLWRNFAVEMSDAEFCYSPLGQSEGDTDRYVPAILMGCIPVMLTGTRYGEGGLEVTPLGMPLYEHPELNWALFSVQVTIHEVHSLPAKLRAIMPKERLRMRQELGRVWPRFLYSRMYGSYLGEDGSKDAFETMVDILRLRVRAMGPFPALTVAA